MSTYQEERFPVPTPRRLVRELRLRRPPWWLVVGLAILVVATWVPLAMIARARATLSERPRVHFILDMDKQPRFGPQSAHPWFADGRAMQMPIDETVARGHARLDDHFYRGYQQTVGADVRGQIEFYNELPPQVTLDSALLERGRQRFDIYCALCHGRQGTGDGIVHQRATAAEEPLWVPPTNLLSDQTRQLADGEIFQAISQGIRNMPPHAGQIGVRDRWAIVAYLRQLQEDAPLEEMAEPGT